VNEKVTVQFAPEHTGAGFAETALAEVGITLKSTTIKSSIDKDKASVFRVLIASTVIL
jgi:hypothetical protein